MSFSFAQHHLHLSEVSSTNDLARQLANENLVEHGYVITADFQTNGRGQESNGWESERGKNILCSLVLNADLSIEHQLYLNISISLAVYDFIKSRAIKESVNIKWPNDIYLNGRKVAGILIENSVQGMKIKQSVIGMGININQQAFVTEKAISLAMATGVEYDIKHCIAGLLKSLEYRYNQLLNGNFDDLWHDYHDCFYRKNMNTSFMADNLIFEGIPVGINEMGRLIISVQDQTQSFNVKEITWL